MTPEQQKLHRRLGRIKGSLFKLIALIESAQIQLASGGENGRTEK